ncbi:hypothetical protein GCM10010909_21610 [Acidocella aquatica]|uniref:Alpha/beta hydrolase n=1 Tax=Acidocella aquatica TaxID=1922313 RepID=A0ABQ6A4S2_9PROT|nr:alpha/beta hydrolase [Acidocella aquatica]GLR67480.1 hypothetical protein GCM10010909_21610 [Acidocella aquatica]
MSEKSEDPKLERRVTAGLRGASWDPALVPAGMSTQVFPLMTADGAPVLGYLHAQDREQTVVFIMHPRELLVSHYLVPHLVGAGYACWVQGPRTVGNDLRLEHELAVLDVGAGMLKLRELGFEHVVQLGNSGGAGLFAFYNHQSLLPPGERLARTPGGRAVKLGEAVLPVVDGFIFVAPHPGQGKLLRNMIDPSVTDERDPLAVDPALDPFSPANGFRPGKEGGARYAPEFVARYREAQAARVARIDARARAAIKQRMAEKARMKEGGAGSALKANFSGIFEVWRTDADLRCFDTTLDPSDRRWGSVWGAEPLVSNVGSVGFARVCTPESWLSTWSGIISRASFELCGGAIKQPVLMIYYTGDNSVFPADAAAIFESIGSRDKQRVDIRGNHHGQSLRLDEQSGQEIAAVRVIGWLRERFV